MTILRAFGLSPVAQINPQTGTTYTLALTDEFVTCANASAITLTVPNNGSIAFPIGTVIIVMQTGAGPITFSPSLSVTLNSSTGNLTTSAQNSIVVLRKVATNTWQLSGDLSVTSNVLNRTPAATVSGTVSKTALMSFSLAGNVLGTNKCVCIEIVGSFLCSPSTARAVTLEFNYGGTAMWADITTAQSTSTTAHPFHAVFLLTAAGATNAQVLGGFVGMGTSAAANSGLGDLLTPIAAATGFNTPIRGTATIDSTSAQTLAVNVTLAATTLTSFTIDYGIAFLLGEGTKGDTGAQGAQGLAGTGTGTLPLSANSPQTGNYTAQLADAGALVEMNSASAQNFTVPPNSSVAYSIGSILAFAQAGAGAVTAVAGAGVTLKPSAIVSSRQDGIVFLIKVATDTWRATGDYA